ncbi:MAG: thermonuclease family protein [Ectothiorhodospiraceae bacterium]|nr:thermonuclease family protein [Ectothiorhodospiraceae bacterium]
MRIGCRLVSWPADTVTLLDRVAVHEATKRASPWDALFVACLFMSLLLCAAFASSAMAAGLGCAGGPVDETATVAQVIDGDTVRLSDGRSVRLIGINTPEIGRKGKPSEPLARKAGAALKRFLGANGKSRPEIGLQYGQEKHDRYGRLLAHVYLPDGKSVEEYMLKQGWGAQIVVPPNVEHLECYRAAERIARQTNKGVWRGIYQPVPVEQLPRDTRGFRIITGRVTRVGKSKRSLWINFPRRPGEAPREGFAVRISHKDIKLYEGWPTNSQKQALSRFLPNKTVTVRGWMYTYKKQLVMRVRHPASLEVKP